MKRTVVKAARAKKKSERKPLFSGPNAKKKRAIVVVLCSILALLCVLGAIALILREVSGRREADASKNADIDYLASYYGMEFYDPDWKADIFSEEEYTGKNLYMTYDNGRGESFVITDENYIQYGIGVELLSWYFGAIQNGDNETLDALFAEEYFESHEHTAKFTPQRIYDIEVKLYSQEKAEDGSFTYVYIINYCIMKNDGTFRRDISSDMTRSQYVTVGYDGEDVFITGIATEFSR